MLDSKKSIDQTSKSGVESQDSDSDEKSKTTKKTVKSSKSKTSKTGESGSENDYESGNESPNTAKSKNKSVRFSTLGKRKKNDELQHSDIDDRRSLDLIPEEPLNLDKNTLHKIKVNPLHAEKERLEIELEKYESKTVEDCHEDIMNILECHDPQKFRKKAKGVQNIPFAMKDFYYRISKDDLEKQKKKSKLTAAQIKARLGEMKKRREQEKFINDYDVEYSRDKRGKVIVKNRVDFGTESKKRLGISKGDAVSRKEDYEVPSEMIGDGVSTVHGGNHGYGVKRQEESQQIKQSYRVRKNISKGLPPDEGKNTKVTLELLQKLHYKDINQSKPDDFKPEKYVTDGDDEADEDSVFDYFFPGNKKKKPKKDIKGVNYSERIMNIKREYTASKGGTNGGNDVVFEEPESMYKSDKESRAPKTNRSRQPSNPGQSKKSHRRVESQINLHSRANKDFVKNSKEQLSVRGIKKGKLKNIQGMTKK